MLHRNKISSLLALPVLWGFLFLLCSCQTFKSKHPKKSLVPIGILDLSLKKNNQKQQVVFGDPYVVPVIYKNKIVTEQSSQWIICSEVSETLSSVKNVWALPNQKGGLSVSPFIIKGNVILAFKSGLIMSVDLRNGRRAWSTQIIGSLVERPIVAHNDHIFLATTDQTLYNLKLKDGSIKWVYQFGENKEAKIRTLSKPLFYRNNLYMGNNDGEIKSLNIETGALNWSYKPSFKSSGVFKDYMGELLIVGNNLYASRYDGHVFSLSLANSGEMKLNWHFTVDENITTSSYNNGLYFVGTNKGSVYALDVEKGTNRWKKKNFFGGTAISSISSGEKNTYITGTRGSIYLLRGTTGVVEWDGDLSTPIFTPPIYFKGMLLFPGKEKAKMYIYLSA